MEDTKDKLMIAFGVVAVLSLFGMYPLSLVSKNWLWSGYISLISLFCLLITVIVDKLD